MSDNSQNTQCSQTGFLEVFFGFPKHLNPCVLQLLPSTKHTVSLYSQSLLVEIGHFLRCCESAYTFCLHVWQEMEAKMHRFLSTS